MTEDEQRLAVEREALTWLATPYHPGAGVKGVGADCALFPLAVYVSQGLIPPTDVGHYPRDWHLHRSEELYLQWVRRFARQIGEKPAGSMDFAGDTPGRGDFVVWRWGRTFSHGAIMLGGPMVIHAYLGVGVTLDDMTKHEELRTRAALFFSLWG